MKLCVIFYSAAISLFGLGAAKRSFPPNFKFGTSTASYQVEGGWDANGKGENIWDRFTHTTKNIVDGSNGDIACDSYNNYKRDVEVLKQLGINYYRFSLSWSRILPKGYSYDINPDGIRYYNDLINELIANGIEPAVTLYHFDLPQHLQEKFGGWASDEIVEPFVELARLAFTEFGDRVKMWLTFNEPVVFCLNGYGSGENAPGVKESHYLCAHNMLKSHGKAYRLYDEKFRATQGGRISLTLNVNWHEPEDGVSTKLSDDAMNFEMGWYSHPIFSQEGDYPAVMKERINAKSMSEGLPTSKLPEFTAEEIEYIKGSYDYFGLNHYTTDLVRERRPNDTAPSSFIVPFIEDSGMYFYFNDSWKNGTSAWLRVVPWGFTKTLVWIKEQYGNPEVIVFENGYSDRGGLEDDLRIDYHRSYLNALLDAVDQGCNITGYGVWSFLDNFEWLAGYTEKFGLYSIDFQDPKRTRTAKKSANFFKDIIKSHSID